ncbi:MAG: hypothetical protein K2M95_01945 [Clostridiales bacterium]|nr:hypothetical protein [Clostridiales bacterium]
MKKSDKINLLHNAIGTYDICRCVFNYDPGYWYFYILDVSENLVLGIHEVDFMLDGFQIRKISDIKKLKIGDGICQKINEENRLLDGIEKPSITLSSWQSVFESLQPLNKLVIVENEKTDNDNNFFYMGYVTEIKKSYIVFSSVDADGVWDDNIKISYSEITRVSFDDRYSRTWQKYLTQH